MLIDFTVELGKGICTYLKIGSAETHLFFENIKWQIIFTPKKLIIFVKFKKQDVECARQIPWFALEFRLLFQAPFLLRIYY